MSRNRGHIDRNFLYRSLEIGINGNVHSSYPEPSPVSLSLPIAINPNQWKHSVREDNERHYR
ncbi:MAG: hypothetical protein RM021_029730 [Nostoc sp. EkiNYC01]|nr:hypothetical protein [Nostoc sp. EkiNYC01]